MVKVQLDYPVSDVDVIKRTESALKSNRKIRLVLMDAISSLPGVRFPWERVCQLCREHNVYSLVDGAQAITQISVNIAKSQPDFFVSSLHKWTYVPRGCAVLYVRRPLQALVNSMPIEENYVV
jgi:hercynylcysteine S-oxide lyase